MKRVSGLLYPAAIALVFGTGLTARADLVHWSYDFDRSPTVVTGGTGGITLTNEPSGHAAGNSDIVATNLKVFSSADPTSPDHLAPSKYTLTLALTDDASHQSATLSFTGTLSGTYSSGSASVKNMFTGLTMQTVTLGGNLYMVTMGPYSPPGPPSATLAGSIAAHVDVRPGQGGGNPPPGGGGNPPPVNHSPEPSTFVLAGLGMAGLGLVSFGRWRRKLPAVGAA
jgi:hypothetical protein